MTSNLLVRYRAQNQNLLKGLALENLQPMLKVKRVIVTEKDIVVTLENLLFNILSLKLNSE